MGCCIGVGDHKGQSWRREQVEIVASMHVNLNRFLISALVCVTCSEGCS